MRYWRHAATTLLLTVVAVTTACPRELPPGAGADVQLPDWVNRVFPEPNGHSAFARVQVEFDPQYEPFAPSTAQEQERVAAQGVRLFINGVDVTSRAVEGSGRLEYSSDRGEPGARGGRGGPGRAQSGVDLSPGQHTARVELVEQKGFGGDLEVVDSFEWTFTIQ